MVYRTRKRNLLLILCTLICAISGSIFALITPKKDVGAQDYCEVVSAEQTSDTNANELEMPNFSASETDSYYSLTDTYMMPIENQTSFGTCWIYSGMTMLESYLQRTTGILYDFSESWISLCAKVENTSMILGDGGNVVTFCNLIKKYGLLFEEDFPYEWEYNIDDSNYQEIYDNYKNKADKAFVSDLSAQDFLSFFGTNENAIKQYLINYGALSISYDTRKAVKVSGKKYDYYGSSAGSANHSITLIGWDDDVTFKDYEGKQHTGAYICLNSWGTTSTSEVVYIAYDAELMNGTIYGLKKSKANKAFAFSVSSSNASVDNYEVGKYDFNGTSLGTGTYADKNIFFYGDIIDIDYSYQLSSGNTDATVRLKVKKDGKDVTNLFSRHFTNKNTKKCELETNGAIDSGRYFVEFCVDYDNDSVADETFVTTIAVLSGTEMCYINPTASESELFTYQSFNKINSTESTNYVYGYTYEDAVVARFELATFSTIVSINLNENRNCFLTSSSNLDPASSNSYSKNSICIQIQVSSEKKAYNTIVTFRTLGGEDIDFCIVIYALEISSDAPTFVFYDNNGGVRSGNMMSWIATGKNYNMTLGEPINTIGSAYQFTSWFADRALTQQISDLNSQAKSRSLSNYADQYYKGNSKYVRKYIYAYAKWDKVPFYMEGANLGEREYGDNIKIELNLAHNGSSNLRYSVDNSTLPAGTNLVSQNGKYYISGNLLLRGDYAIKFICYDIDNAIEISAIYNLTVNKRAITLLICDKSSVYGEPLENLEWTLQSGTIYNGDDLKVNLVCSVAEDSSIGAYTIYGTFSNDNYDVTFINGTYKITKQRILFSLNNYAGVYDGAEHSVELDVSQNQGDILVEYSLDGESYTQTPITEKNYTNGEKIVYIRLSCDNYETEELQTSINIAKKNIVIVWTNDEFTYNGETQAPVASSQDLIDDAQIVVTGGSINAGQYVARANVDSENYQLTNNTKTFVIKKVKPSVSISSDDLSIDVSKLNVGDEVGNIALPQGYEWLDSTQRLQQGANVYYLKFTPTDLTNYETVDNITLTIIMMGKGLQSDIIKYAVIALCGGIILVILISIITTISRKAYERSCLDNHEDKKEVKTNKDDQVIINFVTNAPMTLEPIKSLKRISIALPKLERNYYEFAGWFTDKLFINPYQNNGTEKTITLYAKWLPKIYK